MNLLGLKHKRTKYGFNKYKSEIENYHWAVKFFGNVDFLSRRPCVRNCEHCSELEEKLLTQSDNVRLTNVQDYFD